MPTKRQPKKPTRTTYTDAQRTQALDLYREHGPTHAAEATGISKATITRWARSAGVSTDVTAKTSKATEAARASLEQRKTDLAHRLISKANELVDSMDAPTVEKKIVQLPGKIVLSVDGDGVPELGSGYVVAEAHRDRPTFREQQTIMTTVAIAVDKVQVLTGGVTARYAVEGDSDPQVKSVAAEVVSLFDAARRRPTG